MSDESRLFKNEFKEQALEDLWVWLALLLLLALTFGASFLHWGAWTTVISFAISVFKTLLVAYFYMHLKKDKGMTRIFAIAGIAWLTILFSLTLSDFATRSWLPYPSRWPVIFQFRPSPQAAQPER